MKNKEEYIAKFEELLGELSTKIDELKVQANLGKAEAKEELEKQIGTFREVSATARRKLEELIDSGEEVWEELKFGMDDVLTDMKGAVKKALDKLNKIRRP